MENVKQRDLLNSWGEGFWKRHLKAFAFIRLLMFYVLDMLEDKFIIPELSMTIGALYILDLNTKILGTYELQAICYHLNEDKKKNIPWVFNVDSSFSKYSHWFYFFIFVGNIRSSPYIISLLCALYSTYDTILKLIDASLCPAYSHETAAWITNIIVGYIRAILSIWAFFLWIAVLFFPKKYRKSIQIYEIFGKIAKLILLKVLCCKRRQKTKAVLRIPFTYPFRIIISAWISYAFAFAVMILYSIAFYSFYYLADSLASYKDYLETQDGDSPFIIFYLQSTSVFTVSEGIALLTKAITLVRSLFPCALAGIIIGHLFVIYSIGVMLYRYKQYMLIIIHESDNRELLKRIWRFSSHLAIFFPAQFVINCVFLQFTFSFLVFSILFGIALYINLSGPGSYFAGRTIWFWLSFSPLILGTFYFPKLVEKDRKVKNKLYFCFWDGWYFLIGFIGAFIKGITRYILGTSVALFFGFRAHVSIMPSPFDRLDSLYRSFYGCMTLHCISLGIMLTQREIEEMSIIHKDKGPPKVVF
ncbi:unnamed protein product [Blepharisma stoltei]|uniref:Odorant receptor n=1 Tax=Blepharisma stoltei TaxID=1481888 RepID=A0AAU9JHS9_9CILI|nr:unnamed protein product [Blepharisma stoltei]